MSLLMDALKRAEQAKREQNTDSNPISASSLTLEPVHDPASEAKMSPLPDLNSHLESVEADLKATAAERPNHQNSPAKPDTSMDRAIAQNVLTAGVKNSSVETPAGGKSRIVAIIAIGTLALAGVAGYFYWQLQGLSQNSNRLVAPGLSGTVSRPAPVSPPTPTSTVNAVAPTADASSGQPLAESRNGGVKTDSTEKTAAPNAPSSKKTSPPRPRVAKAAQPTKPSTPSVNEPVTDPLRITAQSQDSWAMRGYNALQAGRFAEAKTAYTQALRNDPRDIDALLGLAVLARREGDSGLAGDYYERVLRADPRNAAGHAGIIAAQGPGDAAQAESRLKSLLNLQNSDANAASALNFALGNLYSSQRRWSEAQQAYFKAHTADAGNPDTLYNLAISLEHLNQKPLARQFYEQAIQASRQRAATFDRALAEQRLAALR